MEILIVEDDPVSRRMLEFTLQRWGYKVTTAADGREAWELLQSPAPPSLIISDWMMPGLDGLELCSRIRNREKSSYAYLIILTARHGKEDVVKGLEAGADDYLVKPFDQEELRCRIKIGERIINLERRILQLANTDPLTGILNRRAFMERMEIELHRANRDNTVLSVVIADLDHFKSINDQHGHLMGDLVLQRFVESVSARVRPYDFLGRFGGEEFAIGLPEVAELQAVEVAERMRLGIESMDLGTLDSSLKIRLTASFGTASLRQQCRDDLNSLIARADDALYQAKREGRNRVCAAQEPCPDSVAYDKN